jgi:hypothetical protein
MSPILVVIGLAALGGAAYLFSEESKKKPEEKKNALPLGGSALPSVPQAAPSAGGNTPKPTTFVVGDKDPIPVPLGPSGLPAVPAQTPNLPNPSSALAAAAASAATANAMAHLTQPQPAAQPPLPPVPPVFNTIPPGRQGKVTTKEEGQAGALRVRSAPSTTAPVVPGGEPSTGGGVPHNAILTMTGPAVNGFVPIQYNNLTGFGWAGYITPI